MQPLLSIAYFVTPHGFGHAARASAVMNAIYARWPFVHFEIFSLVPEWFFSRSLKASYTWHSEQTDVGLCHTSPFHFDLGRTIDALDAFLPFDEKRLEALAKKIDAARCHLVISDISPLGIAVAKHAGACSVLVENFTWDWIYAPYALAYPGFNRHIDMLESCFSDAGLRIQAAPVCSPPTGNGRREAICTPPIAREPTADPRNTREKLGIGPQDKMVLITMGGFAGGMAFSDSLAGMDGNICFVVPGTTKNLPAGGERRNNVVFLPQNAAFYHPDLVLAADAVVGKNGYSTLAEVCRAGVPYGFISRPDFRESPVLASWVRRHMAGIEFTEADFAGGAWLKRLDELLHLPVGEQCAPNGADAAAMHICNFLACEKEILEVVDVQGCVVGAAPRNCVHGDNRLLHQVVHVLVRDKDGRLLLQKRSLNKRVAPGRWDTSVGGHVDCGESIEAAMYREMAEELGIRPKALSFAYQYIHSNDFESELVFTYTCTYDGSIAFNPEEIDAVKFWDMNEIKNSLGKGVLSDNFEDEFRRYQKWLKADQGG